MEGLPARTRRDLMRLGLASSIIAASLPLLRNNALAAGGRLNLADIGVGDPGDWSKFTKPTGWDAARCELDREVAHDRFERGFRGADQHVVVAVDAGDALGVQPLGEVAGVAAGNGWASRQRSISYL